MNDWKTLFRKHELDLIFQKIPYKTFNYGLELGAGAHIQTEPLSQYCTSLISTEYETRFDSPKLEKKTDNIKYISCDAEKVNHTFKDKKFDLVFSSNMMEHLPDPDSSFKGIYSILDNNGVSICTMPSVFMKILYLILFYPAVLPIYSKRIKNKLFTWLLRKDINTVVKNTVPNKIHNNNPKTTVRKKYILTKLLIPDPHGACKSNFKEIFYWRKSRWIKQIESHGFSIIKTIKLPVTTGYSFKLHRICEILFKIGFCSSYAYVAVKNENSKAVKYFS
jgi:SAM-dependent methyltransferase